MIPVNNGRDPSVRRRRPGSRPSRTSAPGHPASRRSAPRLEPLEGRALLAIVVDTFADRPYDPADGVTSLREAIVLAAEGAGADTIELPGGTYALELGPLAIDDPSGLVTIRSVGGRATIDAQGRSQVISVRPGSGATFEGLAILRGSAVVGGGLLNEGSTTVIDVDISYNAADLGAGVSNVGTLVVVDSTFLGNGATLGGGINNTGHLTVSGSRFEGNVAEESGGGIQHSSGTLVLRDSTLAANYSLNIGGGLAVSDGSAAVENSVIDGNSAALLGGGIVNFASLRIDDSSLSGNGATLSGGGVFNFGGSLAIRGGTVALNRAFDGYGGFLYNDWGGTATIEDVLISGNASSYNGGAIYNDARPDHGPSAVTIVGGLLADNASSRTDGGAIYTVGDGEVSLTGTVVAGNRANFGGAIYGDTGSRVALTDVALFGNRADSNGGAALVRDGSTLTVTRGSVTGNSADYGGGIAGFNSAVSLDGTTASDNVARSDGGLLYNGSGLVTLNDVVAEGNLADLYGGAISSMGGTVTIGASRLSGNVAGIVSGALHLRGEAGATVTESTLSGNTALVGGAIFVDSSTLEIDRSMVADNEAEDGGGLYNAYGNVVIRASTLAGNAAALAGGGLHNTGGWMLIENGTLSGNSAGERGGAVFNAWGGGLVVAASTITENSAEQGAGGIAHIPQDGSPVAVLGSIVARNDAPDAPDVSGPFTSGGYNLIGDGSGGTGFGAPGDQVGTSSRPIDPRLGPLRDNGGPTPTHAPMPGSPAIDAGPPAPLGPTDQRGVSRPQGRRSDIGAVELAFRSVSIDIKPGGGDNPINLKSRGVTPLAILTTAAFDAATVDTSDLSLIRLGDPSTGATVPALRANREDVDRDGDLDLILHVSTEALARSGALDAASTTVTLTGFSADGPGIIGTGAVRIVGAPRRNPAPLVARRALVPSPANRDDAVDPVSVGLAGLAVYLEGRDARARDRGTDGDRDPSGWLDDGGGS